MANQLTLSPSLNGHHDSTTELNDAEGKHRIQSVFDLKNTRDLRTILVEAALDLHRRPDYTDAKIMLHDSKMAAKRIRQEVEGFKQITQPGLANRISVIDMRGDGKEEFQKTFKALATYFAKRGIGQNPAPRQPTKASQEAVMAYLLQRYILQLPGVSIGTIAADTKASIPTIYQVLNNYKHCLVRNPEEKTFQLTSFSQGDWMKWMERTNKLASVHFIDRSGMPRNTNRLAKALRRLQRRDLALGGLLGAMHHLPEIDATAAPQLDILVHGTARSDLSFIQQIDPGLERTKNLTEPAHVVVHFLDRPNSLFTQEEGQWWGSLPDCIANMHKARLGHQVEDALLLLKKRNTP